MDPITNYCESVLGDNESAKAVLRLIPEFSKCSDRLLDMVYAYSKPVNIPQGETLIREGLFDQWVYFIIKGELDVVIDEKSLGSTTGPIVGERCILGEPRGANLIAGKSGLMALGVEMTIIDELNRHVNNFRKTATDEAEILAFSEEKLSIALELLIIVLSEVIGRIINIHRTGLTTFDLLAKARPSLNVQLQNLYSFSSDDDDSEEKSEPQVPVNKGITKENGEPSQNIAVYSFEDFADIVYFELLQKSFSAYGYELFSQESWKSNFTVDSNNNPTITKAYAWLKEQFKISNSDLIEITYAIFEVASKYTAEANKSIIQILSISDCDIEKRQAMEKAEIDERTIGEESRNDLNVKLFQPVEKALQSRSSESRQEDSGKMNQSDIDAMFG